MKIVGFGHRKRVGKDTAARLVAAELEKQNYIVEIVAFADPLYDIAHQLYGWAGFKTKEYYDTFGVDKEKTLRAIGKSPRQILIDLGTSAIRNNVWDATWVALALEPHRICDYLFITDVRFPNEVEAITAKGGKVIKIERPTVPVTADLADKALLNYDGWDHVVINDDLNTLAAKVLQCM